MRRRLLNVFAGLWIAAATTLQRFRLRKPPEAWRFCASINLRDEPARMMVGLFGIKGSPADGPGNRRAAQEEFTRRVRDFLSGEPIARVAVENTRSCARAIRLSSLDFCMVTFAADGRLLALTPVLDPDCAPALDSAQRGKIERAVIEMSNTTLAFDASERTGKILDDLRRSHSPAETTYGRRLLQAGFVCFEETANRFMPPAPLTFRFPGAAMFNFVIREMPGQTIDLWTQGQHSVLDGVEFAGFLKRLVDHLGGREEVLFPAEGTARQTLSYPPTKGRELILVADFFDFGPLRQLARKLNRQSSFPLPLPVTEPSLLLWTLGNQPEFSSETFALVVDIPPKEERLRRVDFIVIRPWEFFRTDAPLGGFVNFLAAYKERLQLVQSDKSRPYRTMQNLAQLPPFLAKQLMHLNVRARQRGFGTVTISFLKPVDVSLAPISNLLSDRATFVIGNTHLPSVDGGRVAWVTMKGAPECISRYPDALQRALHELPASLANVT